MRILDTPLVDLKVVESSAHLDDRGAFMRLFCASELRSILGPRQIAQINYSKTSNAGAVRGMHYQHPPDAEMKMIRCLHGRVWDVAVDLRADSPTRLQWYGLELSGNDARMVVIPEGFAHGFQALEPHCELLYLHTAFYQPSSEGGLRHDDPRLSIDWPLPTQDVSPRDLAHPLLGADFTGVAL